MTDDRDDDIDWVTVDAPPCPFCGHAGPFQAGPLIYDTEADRDLWVVSCPFCGCLGPGAGDTPEEAVASWSVRGRPERVN